MIFNPNKFFFKKNTTIESAANKCLNMRIFKYYFIRNNIKYRKLIWVIRKINKPAFLSNTSSILIKGFRNLINLKNKENIGEYYNNNEIHKQLIKYYLTNKKKCLCKKEVCKIQKKLNNFVSNYVRMHQRKCYILDLIYTFTIQVMNINRNFRKIDFEKITNIKNYFIDFLLKFGSNICKKTAAKNKKECLELKNFQNQINLYLIKFFNFESLVYEIIELYGIILEIQRILNLGKILIYNRFYNTLLRYINFILKEEENIFKDFKIERAVISHQLLNEFFFQNKNKSFQSEINKYSKNTNYIKLGNFLMNIDLDLEKKECEDKKKKKLFIENIKQNKSIQIIPLLNYTENLFDKNKINHKTYLEQNNQSLYYPISFPINNIRYEKYIKKIKEEKFIDKFLSLFYIENYYKSGLIDKYFSEEKIKRRLINKNEDVKSIDLNLICTQKNTKQFIKKIKHENLFSHFHSYNITTDTILEEYTDFYGCKIYKFKPTNIDINEVDNKSDNENDYFGKRVGIQNTLNYEKKYEKHIITKKLNTKPKINFEYYIHQNFIVKKTQLKSIYKNKKFNVYTFFDNLKIIQGIYKFKKIEFSKIKFKRLTAVKITKNSFSKYNK
ncbi:hypothetical protein EDEG_00949 [Edhazardia aedis USNM 41457]|uniref:Uncharacterized protein n=1 Tax=Edhazardia aedis (strain USNM 41457) TaxID=1003232 RepID=J9DAR7_EDHAE|nr:hypothetical protein EDEG_00949 [Edhazardia aedis USNM 41457]|eukprot:EJW04856.1 hypothetical protein EDEG_00949 [Edhazardia aedis USNM 41457]